MPVPQLLGLRIGWDSVGEGPAVVISHELALRRSDLVASLQLHCTWGRTDSYLTALFESWGPSPRRPC